MKGHDNIFLHQMLPGDIHNLFLKNRNVFEKNTVLFNQGVISEGLYYLLDGSVKISRVYKKEKERVLKIAWTGDIFGIESFVENLEYAATATVMEDSVISYMSKDELAGIIRMQPFICYSLLSRLYKYLLVSEKRLFIVPIGKVDEFLAEIDTEQKKYESLNPITAHEKTDGRKHEGLPDNNKPERQKHKENYFRLKIKQLIC